MQPSAVDLKSRLADLMMDDGRVNLALVGRVADPASCSAGDHRIKYGLRHPQDRTDKDQREYRHVSVLIRRLVRAASMRVVACDAAADRQHAMVGHEDLFRDQRVRARSAHSGYEPGVFDLELRDRGVRDALIDNIAGLVRERRADHRPRCMPASGSEAPSAADSVAALHPGGFRGRREHAAYTAI